MIYGIVQFIPFIALQISEFKEFKSMRQNRATVVRSADLVPRRFFDMVPPTLLAIAAFTYITALLFDFFIHGFSLNLGNETFQRGLVNTITNGFLASTLLWVLYGRKLDPYQANKDRTALMRANAKVLLLVSISASAFMVVAAVGDLLLLHQFSPVMISVYLSVMMSIYFQIIAFLSVGNLLKTLRVEDMDFEVYKQDSAVRPAAENNIGAISRVGNKL